MDFSLADSLAFPTKKTSPAFMQNQRLTFSGIQVFVILTARGNFWAFKGISAAMLSFHIRAFFYHICSLTLTSDAVTFRELARLLPGSLQSHVMLKLHQRRDGLCKRQNIGILAWQRLCGTCAHVKMISTNLSYSEEGWNKSAALREH